jgi:hypothetical protein
VTIILIDKTNVMTSIEIYISQTRNTIHIKCLHRARITIRTIMPKMTTTSIKPPLPHLQTIMNHLQTMCREFPMSRPTISVPPMQ